MYEENETIITPLDETVLWRFMNLEKLLELLCSKTLFMCRLDKFSDPWEGVWPKAVYERMRQFVQPDGEPLVEFFHKLKKRYFANCWYSGDQESAALWDIHANRTGLAIKTTSRRLKTAIFSCKQPFYVGLVSYRDYASEDNLSLNLFSPPFMKRKSFEYEREVRILVSDLQDKRRTFDWSLPQQESMTLHVDLTELVEGIYLSPHAPNWLLPCIEQLVAMFKLDIEIQKSRIYDEQIY